MPNIGGVYVELLFTLMAWVCWLDVNTQAFGKQLRQLGVKHYLSAPVCRPPFALSPQRVPCIGCWFARACSSASVKLSHMLTGTCPPAQSPTLTHCSTHSLATGSPCLGRRVEIELVRGPSTCCERSHADSRLLAFLLCQLGAPASAVIASLSRVSLRQPGITHKSCRYAYVWHVCATTRPKRWLPKRRQP